MRRMILWLLFFLAALAPKADAASRFWNPYSVTGAISGTGGVCRLTISPAITGSGLVAGTAVVVTSITGATGCNVSTTVSTVVDTTHIELAGTTFGGAYVSGGCVSGGVWTATNTSNWAATSTATCGSGGQTVPGSSDTVTQDANSLTGTIVPNTTITVSSIDCTASVGGLDFSVNNNNVTLGPTSVPFNCSGSGVRSFKMGNGTWALSTAGASNIWSMGTTTNLTFSANSSTLNLTSTTSGVNSPSFQGGALTYNNVGFTDTNIAGFQINGSNTFNTLTLNPGGYQFQNNSTQTITTLSVPGTSSSQVFITNNGIAGQTTFSIASNAPTITWAAIRSIVGSGGATFAATSSFNLGGNSGITFTPPSGRGVIGGL